MATRKKSTARKPKQRKPSKPWWQNRDISQWLVLAIVAAFIALLPSLSNELTSWDDNIYVTENPMIYGFGIQNLKAMFTQPIGGNYHPITMLSLAVNYQFSGIEPFGYHLTNLLLHLLNVGLVFYFVWLLSKGKKWVAFAAAILFGVHPMHVESVAWLAERKDVLYTFFFLLGLISYLRFRVKKESRLYAFTFLWFFLSILSKPAAVIFPVVLILLDYWRFEQSKSKSKRWDWKKIILPKIPFFIVSLLMGLTTLYTQSPTAISDADTFGVFQKFSFVCYGFVMYVLKAIIPFQLSAFYAYPSLNSALPLVFKIMPIGAIAIIAGIWYSWKHTKIVVLGMAFFFVNIVLVMQFISVGAAIMADRYTYVPYIGIFIIMGYGFDRLIKQKHTKTIAAAVAAVYIIGLTFFSFQRSKVWENDDTIWTDVLEKYPNSIVALNNRAVYYDKDNQLEAALKDYNKAIKLRPKYHAALVGRSNLYQKTSEFDKALADAKAAIAIKAEDERPYINIAGVYFKQNKPQKAIEVIGKALAINPSNSEALINRGVLYSTIGDFQKSLPDFEKYISLRPSDFKGYLYRGISYKSLQQSQKALKDINQALQLDPQNGQAYFYRSETYLQLNKKGKALKDAQKAKSYGFNVTDAYLQSLQ
ncbi:MAG: tetratricopeptide repeat protein [Chitinophagales bacterium]